MADDSESPVAFTMTSPKDTSASIEPFSRVLKTLLIEFAPVLPFMFFEGGKVRRLDER